MTFNESYFLYMFYRISPVNHHDFSARMLVTGMLVILDMGSLFVEDNDGGTTMVICCWFSMGGSPAPFRQIETGQSQRGMKG